VGRLDESSTVRLRRLATELTRLREAAGLTREQVASQLGCPVSTVFRLETGRNRPQPRTLRALLDLYQVTGVEREALIALAQQSRTRGWWHAYSDVLPGRYVGLEAAASSIRNYEPTMVPGLLQTEAYARAVVGAAMVEDPEEVARRVAARMARQAVLTDPNPLRFWAIIDEAVLYRTVGGPEVMRKQLDHLVHMVTTRPNVTLQVLPFTAGAYLSMGNPLVILSFPDPADSDVVFLENIAGELYLEDPESVTRYSVVFDHLRAAALSPEETVALIKKVAAGRTTP